MAEQNKGAAIPSKYGYREYHLRVWHGMTIRPWLGLVWGNLSKISLRRIPLAITVTIAALVNSVLATVTQVIFGQKIANVKIEKDPIFIVGHWRSGTTWLNELMILDDRHGYPENFHAFTPEVFLLTRKLSNILDWFLPKSRPMDKVKVDMSRPQEDEFAILGLGLETPYRYMALPTLGSGENRKHHFWPQHKDRQTVWLKKWMHFIRSVQLIHPGKRLILKSPPHTGRIAMLKSQFPNAKFIHICREPAALFASTMKMQKAMAATQGFQIDLESDEAMHAGVFKTHNQMYKAFYKDVKTLDPANICFVKFEELRAAPLAHMKKIYDHLQLGGFDGVKPRLEMEIGETRNFKPDQYSLEPELAEKLNHEWATYFEEFDYPAVKIKQGAKS